MEKIKKSDHFYLIDGSGYIFRAYYALPPLTRKSDGLPVGAVSGFVFHLLTIKLLLLTVYIMTLTQVFWLSNLHLVNVSRKPAQRQP